jgi:cell division protein FtsZ
MSMIPKSTHPQANPPPPLPHLPVIKVLGLGGGGSNAVDRMLELGLTGVEFIAANTDKQALMRSQAAQKIQLGPKLTRGLGAGGKPSVGRKAALESRQAIYAAIKDSDMVFLTAGMGGGTGTGAIPIAAKIAREMKIVTIAVVTTPFSFEMGHRQKAAADGLAQLQRYADTLITIPNDRLLFVAPQELPLETAFRLADDVLRQAVQSITELITEPGLINVDFAHIRRLMRLGGGALMAIGHGHGEHKAIKAVKQALDHPLLETVSLERAAGVVVNFTASENMSLEELSEALLFLQEETNPDTEVVMGTSCKEHMNDRVQVHLVVTGLGAPTLEEVMHAQEPQDSGLQPALSPSGPTHAYPSVTTADLDIPAFLRRQSRFSGR